MKSGKADPTQIFGEGDKHKTESSNIVAEKLGIGSGEQYRKEKFISDNRSILKPEDFSDWDEGRLSTNKAFQKIKEEKKLLEEQVKQLELSNQNIQNYEKLTYMIPELEELQDENSKLRALISNNFGRRKNDPVKDRKALETYVSLRGYKQGGNGSNQYKQKDHNELFAKATLDEIAKELNMSTTNLKRALRIERNLTDSMKEVIVYYVLIISCIKDFGVIRDVRGVSGELVGREDLRADLREYLFFDN